MRGEAKADDWTAQNARALEVNWNKPDVIVEKVC